MSRAPRRPRSAPDAAAPPPPGAAALAAWAPFAMAVLGAFAPLAVLREEWRGLGTLSFPVDDAWIHLTYARNLAQHLSCTYFPGTPPSAGSTAPLFTLLEALALRVTGHGTAVALALGFVFHAAFLGVFAAWARRRLGPAWATLAVAVVALDGRLVALSVSGMETSLFVLLGTLALLAHDARRPLARGVALGLAAWTRPDGLLLAAALGVDALLSRGDGAGRPSRRDTLAGLGAFAALVAGWMAWNTAIGGTPLPATFAAKVAFYGAMSRTAFVTGDVARTFASGGWLLLAPLAAVAIVREGRLALARVPSPVRAALGAALVLPLAYAVLLPFSHRFERYLAPALPPLAIVALAQVRDACTRWPRVRVAAGPFAAAVLGLHALAFAGTGAMVTDFVRMHRDVHVRAAHWIAERTPPGAVIATHDVGALGWYGNRRIVDVVGLVTPGIAPHLRRPDYLSWLRGELDRRHVTHVASLDEWLPVEGVEPLFSTGANADAMRLYAWGPAAHLVEPRVRAMQNAALEALRAGDFGEMVARLEQARAADPASPRTWTLLGMVAGRTGAPDRAIEAFREALRLAPGARDARMGLAMALAASGRRTEARAVADSLAAEAPGLPGLATLRDSLAGR